jgi:superfamily II DNA helicase RecQ
VKKAARRILNPGRSLRLSRLRGLDWKRENFMSVQYKFFVLPIPCGEEMEEELNAFLRSIRLIAAHRERICQDERHYWSIVVEYLTGNKKSERREEFTRQKIDYKEKLSPEDFTIFAKLRDWRKEAAAREAVQLYNIFMNEQLAEMVEKKVTTKAALMEIEGIGTAKAEKYGDAVLEILRTGFMNSGEADASGKMPVCKDS